MGLLKMPLTCTCARNDSRGGGDGDLFAPAAIAYTVGSVTVPSLASVYNEFALKKHMDTSVHEQNFFLYFYGACFNLAGVFGVMAFSRLSWADVFRGHTLARSANFSPDAYIICRGMFHAIPNRPPVSSGRRAGVCPKQKWLVMFDSCARMHTMQK